MASVLGCGPQVVGGDGDSDGATGGSSGAGPTGPSSVGSNSASSSAGTAADTTGPADGSGSADGSCPPDDTDEPSPTFDIGMQIPCDIFAQDCEPGDKCVPRYHAWVECVAQDPEPLPDDAPCELGAVSDPCGPTSWCAVAGATDPPVCTPMCTGTPTDPICPDGRVCIIDDEDAVAECQRPCDPFDANACAEGTCQPTARGFGCLQSGGQAAGEGCYEHDSCGAGLACAPGDEVPACCDGGCCTPLCAPDQPCASGVCVRFEPGIPGAEGLGMCVTG